ncbi:uncharacterized protein LAESUDRAFT_720753 [Laetiporus sulphureus 93-53]|uniref:NYN domain-containing protein n=1 Tax=Laetiporus sulphureus 93-53 TaxID=1314785 RepID=A0A165HBG8_9APHY|nr:uncharacterized protein LAESUDRAFT_720753 [Laetiporus sulphureus 93-53]KZT11505.1 hypothetical protein LAESUDRAFT_720753 [Laetiporus sulphureus 93-53]
MPGSENVAIFWDYENCALPANVAGNVVVNSIRKIAHEYGSVKTFKAYLELPEQSSPKSIALRSELQLCGVSLIDCPHNGRKDVADKMMIVDMMAYAIDTPAPATIILISGDRDFVYAVSVLSLRQYRLVIFAPTAAHSSLKLQASVVHAWPADVLPEELLTTKPRTSVSSGSSEYPRSRSDSNARYAPQVAQPTAVRAFATQSPPVTRKDLHDRPSYSTIAANFSVPPWVPFDPLGPFKNSPPPSVTPLTDSTAVESESDGPSSSSVDGNPSPGYFTLFSRTPGRTFAAANAQAPFEFGTSVLNQDQSHSSQQIAHAKVSATTAMSPSSEASFQQQPSQLDASDSVLESFIAQAWGNGASASASLDADDSTPSKKVPAHFKALVKVLKQQLKDGNKKVSYSDLGTLLRQESSMLYEKAGVTKLKDYTALAEEAGVVVVKENRYGPGGVDGQKWVSLHPRLLKTTPAVVPSSMDEW